MSDKGVQREGEEEKGRKVKVYCGNQGRPDVIVLRAKDHQALKESFHKKE